MTVALATATVGAMTTWTPAPLTEAQEEVLVLLGHDEAGCIHKGLQRALDELFSAGLVTFTADQPVLTATGRAALDRLLLD